jgi:hypothetical protein
MFTIFDQTAIDHGIERTRPVGSLRPVYDVRPRLTRRVPNIDGPTGDLCYRCAAEPIDKNHDHLGRMCLDADSADAFERNQAAGYRDGLDVTNRRPTLPEFHLRRI